jgi:hypothetical protein
VGVAVSGDLRQRIETVLCEHVGPAKLLSYIADAIMSVLQPDIDSIARAICAADTPIMASMELTQGQFNDHYRELARAAVDAWTGAR